MRLSLWATALASVLLPCGARAADPAAINRAINSGTRALRALQAADGSWEFASPSATPGATALAALALLECGANKDDPAVVNAAKFVRKESMSLRLTYSISAIILFLDRLGDPADESVIESLAARLVAGQNLTGNWAYLCPDPVAAEQLLMRQSVTAAARDPSGKGAGRKEQAGGALKASNFTKLVTVLRQQGSVGPMPRGDNSNTQFAMLGLWACRRHGLPVDRSLMAAVRHFRDTQVADGQWMYDDTGTFGGPSATMTCAGLLAISIGHGLAGAKSKEADAAPGKGRADKGGDNKPKAEEAPAEDRRLKAGLIALSKVVDLRLDQLPPSPTEQGGMKLPKTTGGRSFFLIWSVGRTAVALGMDTLGDKDWYDWGADLLLANQGRGGTWDGSYGQGGVDTSFALLFLKKANLLDDLTQIMGHVRDPGQRVLRSRVTRKPSDPEGPEKGNIQELRSGQVPRTPEKGNVEEPQPGPPPSTQRALKTGGGLGASPGEKLAASLVAMPAGKQEAEIDRLREQKGAIYTEALAAAIPFLEPDPRRKARSALAEREARMRLETIGRDLHDENPEIRAAAAQACALKESKNKETRQLIPQLIGLLSDPEAVVARAAHAALKDLSGEDFGPPASAGEGQRKRAVEEWQAWWKKQSR
jgi:hypothetical protein